MPEEPEEQPENNFSGPNFVPDNQHRPQEPEANMDEFDCPQLIVDAGFQETDALATDAGCKPVHLSNDSNFVSMKELLNCECQLIKRLNYPTYAVKKFQRFFQNFASILPGR